MNEAIHKELAALEKRVQAAAITDTCKQTALWCTKQLPALYTKFGLTNESRYGDEISRLVQALLKELQDGTASPEAQKLGASIADRFRLVHEQLGLPVLNLKSPRPAAPRPRKARLIG